MSLLLEFEAVMSNDVHADVLFDLLAQREYSISHKSMPDILIHREFVKNHPYRFWYLIKCKEKYIGTVYLTFENHISISIPVSHYEKMNDILEWTMHVHEPLSESKSIRPASFQMNVSLEDIHLAKVLDNLGHKKIQVTYAITNNQS
ncbi:MAG: hypothetical protein CMF45_08385 [Legionellales bacterium]|nr:hypothetical protein [Legionellales bacterium]